MYIGENLTSKQVATLQAIADACCGCRFTSYDSLHKIILNKPTILLDKNGRLDVGMVEEFIEDLAEEGLVEMKIIKYKPHVGLTSDGKRCNRINVIGDFND